MGGIPSVYRVALTTKNCAMHYELCFNIELIYSPFLFMVHYVGRGQTERQSDLGAKSSYSDLPK